MKPIGAEFDCLNNLYTGSTNLYLDSVGLWNYVSSPAIVSTHIRTKTDHLLINWGGRGTSQKKSYQLKQKWQFQSSGEPHFRLYSL